MKKTILPCAWLFAIVVPQAAFAVEPYVTAQYMQSKSSCQGFVDGVAPLGLTADCDETDGGFRAAAGANLTRMLGVEVGYQDAGEGRADAFDPRGTYVLTLTAPFKAWDVLGTVRHELGKDLRIVGRVGLARWDYEVKASSTNFGAKNDGNTLTFGAGAEYKWFTVGYDAVLDVGQTNLLVPTQEIKQTIHRLSVGLKYTFKRL